MEAKKRLFTPGPTEVPGQVLEAMARPLVHHRTEPFRVMQSGVMKDLQYIFRTENPVVILAASGTGAMEAAVANLTSPGEKVVVTVCGKFGERWRELAQAYRLEVVSVEAPWGHPVAPDTVDKVFRGADGASILFTTHCETSTGVLQDIERFAKIAHEHGALVAVDAITSLCAQVVETDAWGLDVVVGGSQKGFAVPPGLSFIALSRGALGRIGRAGHPVYYFDLARALKSAEKGESPYTPAISLVVALRESLSMIKDEGLENTIRRHEMNASAVRAAVRALGLGLFAETPCNATTAVVPPEGRASEIAKTMERSYGVKIALGQAHLKGRILRLGHLGFYSQTDMYTLISALEAALADLDLNPYPGKGVEALLRAFRAG